MQQRLTISPPMPSWPLACTEQLLFGVADGELEQPLGPTPQTERLTVHAMRKPPSSVWPFELTTAYVETAVTVEFDVPQRQGMTGRDALELLLDQLRHHPLGFSINWNTTRDGLIVYVPSFNLAAHLSIV